MNRWPAVIAKVERIERKEVPIVADEVLQNTGPLDRVRPNDPATPIRSVGVQTDLILEEW